MALIGGSLGGDTPILLTFEDAFEGSLSGVSCIGVFVAARALETTLHVPYIEQEGGLRSAASSVSPFGFPLIGQEGGLARPLFANRRNTLTSAKNALGSRRT